MLPKDAVECRKKKGMSLNEIAEATRIGLHYLEAIERGNFQKMPGGVYNLSYIRQYARAVGYDEKALVEYYLEVAGPDPEPATPPQPKDPSWMRRFRYGMRSRFAGLGRHTAASGVRH